MKEMQEFEKVERQAARRWMPWTPTVQAKDYEALLTYAKELQKQLEGLHESFADSIEARSRGL